MLGSLDASEKKVTVIGAGISGLIAAFRLDALDYEVTLIEKNKTFGGMISTLHTPWGIAEQAAHSLLVSREVEEFFRFFNLSLLPARCSTRWIRRDGKLQGFPLRWNEFIELLLRACFKKAENYEDLNSINLERWTERHLGSAALEVLIGPMVQGIYASHPREISVAAAFPEFLIPENHSLASFFILKFFKNNFYKKRSQMMAPQHGMGSLVLALGEYLKERLGKRFILGEGIKELPKSGNIVLCVPAPEAALLLSQAEPELASMLKCLQYSPLVTATVFLEKSSVERIPQGVGFLNALSEKSPFLGVLFNSNTFEGRVLDEKNTISCTAMLGGTRQSHWLHMSDDELKPLIESGFKEIFGIHTRVLGIVIRKWRAAIPQYNSDLMKVWTQAKIGWCSQPGRIIFSNYSGEVSIRKMIEAKWS